MKVRDAAITNWKRIRYVEVKPEGELIVVGGRNGQGKTSFLDALASCFSGKKPDVDVPVRRGEDRSVIVINTDDGYTIRQYQTPGTAENPGGTYGLKVTLEHDGNTMTVAEPAKFLSGFWNKLTFDPMAFKRMSPASQGEQLRSLLHLDFFELDKRRLHTFESRSQINRDIRDAEGQLKDAPDISDVPVDEVSLAEVMEGYRDAQRVANENGEVRSAVRKAQAEHDDAYANLERAKARMATAEERLGNLKAVATKLPADPDLDAWSERLSNAEANNAQIRAAARIRQLHELLETRKAEAAAYTSDIEAIDSEKRRMIAEAPMPVQGLSFAEDGTVLYRGLPLNQAAESECIKVSAAIGIAMAPKLKVLLIRDGSLLDDDSMRVLEELATESDTQIFIERVGALGAQIILEDGAIAHEPMPWDGDDA